MKTAIRMFPAIFLIIAVAGCSKIDPSINATRLRISITDAPALTVSELNVDIRKIEVSTVDTVDNNRENWTALDFSGGVYNVLPLSNGKSKQIIDQYFPSGVLRRLKITFGDLSTLKTPEGVKNLVLSPEVEDGVIVDANANLYANYISHILIDINAALSFYESNGNYFFRPVIRAFPETFGGSLKGYALPDEAGPRVIIVKDADTLFTLPERADGMFMFKGLREGEWKIFVQATPNSGYRDTVFTDTVFTGKTRELKAKIILKK